MRDEFKSLSVIFWTEVEKAVTLAGQALHALITAQRVCEEMYINAPDPVIELVNTDALSRQDMRSRRDGPAVVYTEAEKHRIDNILKAFAGFIREQSYFDIIFSEKIGYFQILSGLCATEPVSVIKTAEEMADMKSSARLSMPLKISGLTGGRSSSRSTRRLKAAAVSLK